MPQDPSSYPVEQKPTGESNPEEIGFEAVEALRSNEHWEILARIDGRMTVFEIADVCNLPLSTTYRKINDLHDAGLLREELRIRDKGDYLAEYECPFRSIQIRIQDGLEIDTVTGDE
jgi:predicted transcriptional regulator